MFAAGLVFAPGARKPFADRKSVEARSLGSHASQLVGKRVSVQSRFTFTSANAFVSTIQMSIAVTGATGRTGKLVVKALLNRGETVHALTRDAIKSQMELPNDAKLKRFTGNLAEADTNPAALKAALDAAFAGCRSLVLCTSAIPQVTIAPGQERPTAIFPPGLWPETIDYKGGLAQLEAAKAAGINHIVFISSMGMSMENHPLNSMGPNGNILKWKKKAEDALRASGIKYTVIRPAGLLDEEGGKKKLVVGNDDLAGAPQRPSVPRADVAEVAVRALSAAGAACRTFDLWAVEGAAPSEADFAALFDAVAKLDDAKHAPAA